MYTVLLVLPSHSSLSKGLSKGSIPSGFLRITNLETFNFLPDIVNSTLGLGTLYCKGTTTIFSVNAIVFRKKFLFFIKFYKNNIIKGCGS